MGYADDKDFDLRASDAERDAAVAVLSRHFQDGRLDQAEFDQRMSVAMTAKTRGALAGLLADLPARQPDRVRPAAAGQAPARACGQPRLLGAVPVIITVVLVAGLLGGGWHAHWALWLIIPILVMRTWVFGGRWRAGHGRR